MYILLDTHIYIWWLNDSSKLSKRARSLIINASDVYVSSASIWEAAIKIQMGKLEAKLSDLVSAIEKSGFKALPITAEHAAKIIELPNHHKDPFDRILIAQSMTEPLRFLTVDQSLENYSDLIEIV